jgi:hypothetical protein
VLEPDRGGVTREDFLQEIRSSGGQATGDKETRKINEQEVRRSGGSIRYKKNSLSPNLL